MKIKYEEIRIILRCELKMNVRIFTRIYMEIFLLSMIIEILTNITKQHSTYPKIFNLIENYGLKKKSSIKIHLLWNESHSEMTDSNSSWKLKVGRELIHLAPASLQTGLQGMRKSFAPPRKICPPINEEREIILTYFPSPSRNFDLSLEQFAHKNSSRPAHEQIRIG